MKTINFDNIKDFNKSISGYFILSLILFLGTAFVAGLILKNHSAYVTSYIHDLMSKKETMPDLHTYKLFIYLFFCNLLVCIVSVITGKIPFLFIPALLSINSGYTLGIVFAASKVHKFNMLLYFLFGIAPHGIFEIPAFLYATGIGIYLSKMNTFAIIKNIPTKEHNAEIKKAFLFIIIPLLLIAALIEAFVTPILLTFIR